MEFLKNKKVLVTCIVANCLIFVIDLQIPLGIAVGASYIAVVLYALRDSDKKTLFIVSIFCTFLTILAIVVKPSSGELWRTYTNRSISLMVIWIGSIMGYQIKKQEITVRKLALMLEKRNKQLAEYDFTVAHDLKAPIASIKSYLELIKIQETKSDLDSIVKKLTDLTDNAVAIINGFLNRATGKKSSKNNLMGTLEISIVALTNKILNTLRSDPSIVTYDLGVTTFWGNEIIFQQIFANLIGNSIKYAHPKRACQILISTKSENDFFQISIKDNGLGIKEKELPTLFVKESRAESNKANIEGHGIGLFTVKKLVEECNGSITVTSIEGQETCFTISLKLSSVQPIAPHTVLIIDDDPEVHIIAKHLLSKEACLIHSKYDGINLEKSILELKADCILIDLNLKETQSLPLISSLHQQFPALKIITISANIDESKINELLNSGTSGIIEKPLNRERLISTIWF